MDLSEVNRDSEAVLDEVSEAVIADRGFLETVLLGVLARGHVLLEDVPGTGKTLTARSFAKALGLSFSRIQFTPDLLPADVTGTHVFNEKERTFEFNKGPIFANVVLADEINRAPPKTQAALLEAMEEQQVTTEGETRKLPDPFFVIATQNPIEQEGTFPLPEAQVDRFVIKTSIGYPDLEGELKLLRRRASRRTQTPTLDKILSTDKVKRLQNACEEVRIDDDVLDYIAALSRETREDHRVSIGVSPRGTQRLFEVSRARAVINGREFVTPDDVKEVSHSVLDHRLVLTPDARVSNVSKSTIIEKILSTVPVPTIE
ncbi:MAG: MoxR family ATPase [Halobacteria archaeon]|nr:MoxR family ATPase [Halobacteria archaeon]